MKYMLALLLVTSVAFAQGGDYIRVQRVINDKGHRCDRVANIRPGAKITDGDALLIADCTDGSSHVIRYTPTTEAISYYMDCKSWLNPVKCN